MCGVLSIGSGFTRPLWATAGGAAPAGVPGPVIEGMAPAPGSSDAPTVRARVARAARPAWARRGRGVVVAPGVPRVPGVLVVLVRPISIGPPRSFPALRLHGEC